MFFMKLSNKLGKIKLMRLITKTNTDNLFFTVYFSINGVQERSTKYNGTPISSDSNSKIQYHRIAYTMKMLFPSKIKGKPSS